MALLVVHYFFELGDKLLHQVVHLLLLEDGPLEKLKGGLALRPEMVIEVNSLPVVLEIILELLLVFPVPKTMGSLDLVHDQGSASAEPHDGQQEFLRGKIFRN